LKEDEMGGYVVHMGEMTNTHRILVGRPEGKEHLRDQAVDGRFILGWILKDRT
jgi:hypothetical protein